MNWLGFQGHGFQVQSSEFKVTDMILVGGIEIAVVDRSCSFFCKMRLIPMTMMMMMMTMTLMVVVWRSG